MPPVKDDLIREINCLDVNLTEKSPAKGTALVDVRACNKPVAKVRWNYYFCCVIKVMNTCICTL